MCVFVLPSGIFNNNSIKQVRHENRCRLAQRNVIAASRDNVEVQCTRGASLSVDLIEILAQSQMHDCDQLLFNSKPVAMNPPS